ncbi:hypothetical protein H5410_048384 [Solanum commersonii]|uniref:F-box family protein n=1 Tax=Solanum commersonii TaxID=4109 RepID=A0A9J5XLJ7_SOLCO|nr:hypothetical protein H5410_048384 [Solanum commersonii]
MGTSSADMLSVCLIRKILCYLSYGEATWMRILSKTWLQAWLDLPNLEFEVTSGKSITIVDEITNRYRDGNIPIDKFEFHNFTKPDHIYPLIDRWLDIVLQNGLHIIDYENMKSLEILNTEVSYRYLNNLISIPYCLDRLILANNTVSRFDVCRSQSLRVLKIRNCKIIGAIDAPNLRLFEYKGRVIPQLKFVQESRQLKHLQIILDPLYNLDAAWFCDLRKFLPDSTSWSHVTLCFLKCNEINLKSFQLQCRAVTPKVDVLDAKFLMPTGECPTFVDALLWSCRPRKLNLQSTSEMFTCFVNCLREMKNLSHGQLKEAKVYKFDQKSQSWHCVEHKRGESSQ